MAKSLHRFLAAFVLAFVPFVAAAAEYEVDIDAADRVDIDINGTLVQGLHDGVNIIDTGSEMYIRVITKAGVVFTDVTKIDNYFEEEIDMLNRVETAADGRQFVDLSTYYPEDETFRIRTASSGDARSASCTITIDDPAKAIVTRKGVPLELTAGLNTVPFDPASESLIEIVSVDRPLYNVTHNGNTIAATYRYSITVADGDEIGIRANYPDIDYAVTFSLNGPGAADFFTEVDVDGKPEFNWRAEGFKLKAGSELSLKGNTTEFEVLEFSVNGHTEMFTNPTRLYITEETAISVTVRKYTSFEMTINVDDPARVHIYRGYSYNGDELQLQAGANTVEITRNTPIVSLVPADGCFINTLEISGYDYEPDELKRAPVLVGSLTDGEVLNVTTGTIVRDRTATVFVHNLAASQDYFKLLRADLSAVEVAEGYNTVAFYDRDNDFRFETGGPVEAAVYLNDEAIQPEPGGFNYCPTLADGDVVKVFFDFTPALHSVAVEATPEAAEAVTITRDHATATPVADFKALTHTHVAIAPVGDALVAVKQDGTALTHAADGTYALTVTADTRLTIECTSDGISDIAAEDAPAEYYNLQGMRVAQPEPGRIYIVRRGAAVAKELVK